MLKMKAALVEKAQRRDLSSADYGRYVTWVRLLWRPGWDEGFAQRRGLSSTSTEYGRYVT